MAREARVGVVEHRPEIEQAPLPSEEQRGVLVLEISPPAPNEIKL